MYIIHIIELVTAEFLYYVVRGVEMACSGESKENDIRIGIALWLHKLQMIHCFEVGMVCRTHIGITSVYYNPLSNPQSRFIKV